jgi:SAM-dependent methyltransferase
MPFLDVTGICPICESQQRFVAETSWLRDGFKCGGCNSIPRHRALLAALEMFRPDWRKCLMHESSPEWIGASPKFQRECPNYSYSHYDPSQPAGIPHPVHGWRNENLEELNIRSGTFDIFVTQDVFEHVFEPHRAIAEIARTLRPGGMHICSIPMENGKAPTQRCALRTAAGVEHIIPPRYHANPVDTGGSLVTFNWGYDVAPYLDSHSGLKTTIVYIDDLSRGIRGELIEIMVMLKTPSPGVL